MVPQPSRTLDHQRKEELILQKQIRQSTAKIKKNLPTLIGRHTEQLMKLYLTVTSFSSTTEASPDFNSKKHQLPYLPYLPPSVQAGCLSPVSPYRDLFDTDTDDEEANTVTDVTSVVTDEMMPALYSVPHKLRSESR